MLNTAYGAALPAITTPITIQGNGNTTLDAEGAFRVLHVVSGGDLTLNNTTSTGGSADYGGGIRVADGTLALNDSTVGGNYANEKAAGFSPTPAM